MIPNRLEPFRPTLHLAVVGLGVLVSATAVGDEFGWWRVGVGNVVSRTDGSGATSTLAYDSCDRLVSRTTAGGVDSFSYDLVGNMSAAADGIASETFVYDARNRLTSATTHVGIAAGVAVGLHGTDVAIAGYYTMANGVSQDTLTSQGLQAVGVPQDWANGIDVGISMAGTLGVGAAARGGALSVNLIENSSITIPVSHWGTKEISNGSWVMKGSGSRMDYLLSGKWQPEWMPGKNMPVSYGSGNVYNVPPSTLSFPSGGDWIKGLLGQRIYNGPTILPISPISVKQRS